MCRAVCFFLKKLPGKEWLEMNKRHLAVHVGKGRIHLRNIEMFSISVDIFEAAHFGGVLVSSISSLSLRVLTI